MSNDIARMKQAEADKFEKLSAVLRGKHDMLIVLQDNPDPDAIASAAALKELANQRFDVACSVAHGGVVGRAENRAMLKYLGLNMRRDEEVDVSKFDVIAMVDTQPGTGNNFLPNDIVPDVVIDHHPIRRLTRSARFTDVRNEYGAASTILLEYLARAGIQPEMPLATALLYGIRSDTQDLGRDAVKQDIDAVTALYPMANKRQLGRIAYGAVPQEYFQCLADALKKARMFDHCIITGLGDLDNPDMIAEVADLLLRNEESVCSLCYGFYEGKALLSLRTSDADLDADATMRRIVGRIGTGGGHNMIAGGQIPLRKGTPGERRRIESTIRRRFLQLNGVEDERGKALVK